MICLIYIQYLGFFFLKKDGKEIIMLSYYWCIIFKYYILKMGI